ncbi:hypothetical protein QJS10_CPB17g00321 [Acorus calamus]|uniref:KIB1-4 beta-propeller domain-containing protein n=1 Tax=Acorus calamus TaxID=4465 RepID=A0AAV9CVB3_ACOCL|nr:hypothetical protein QJS10_CPB17g00321 [Acorus calamus]
MVITSRDDHRFKCLDDHKKRWKIRRDIDKLGEIIGASHGWLVSYNPDDDENQLEITLSNPFRNEPNVALPPERNIWWVTLSAPPTTPGGFTAVARVWSSPRILFSHSGDGGWTDLNPVINGRFIPLESISVFKGEFHALGNSGNLYRMDLHNNNLNFVAPTAELKPPEGVRKARRHLVETGDNELLTVVQWKKLEETDKVAREFEVHRLDLPSMKWVKVESLGDQVIYVSRYTAVTARVNREGGAVREGNRIYFTKWKSKHGWFVFNMSDGSVEAGPRLGMAFYAHRYWIKPGSM